MDIFYKTQLGKIASTLVHDHSNVVCLLGSVTFLMRNELSKDIPDMSIIAQYVEDFSKYTKKLKDPIDYCYIQLKEVEENKLKG